MSKLNFGSAGTSDPNNCRVVLVGLDERELYRLFIISAWYSFDDMKPPRDSAFENDLIIHEMTHGVTNRMTGGGTGRCLQTLEAGGLGEGWSDAMAEFVVFFYLAKELAF